MSGLKYCQLWTLDRIKEERCVEEGDCWLWSGAMSGVKKETPVMWFRGKVVQAYVATWMIARGLDVAPEGLTFWRSCRNMRCVNPECVLTGSKQKRMAFLADHGAFACSPSRKAAITIRARANSSKLEGGMQGAREIRASSLSDIDAARKYGVSVSCVNRIRNGKSWRETAVPHASIFSMGVA